jgi:hypothetical protein
MTRMRVLFQPLLTSPAVEDSPSGHGVEADDPDEQRREEHRRDQQAGACRHPGGRPCGHGERGRDVEPDDAERRHCDAEEDRPTAKAAARLIA